MDCHVGFEDLLGQTNILDSVGFAVSQRLQMSVFIVASFSVPVPDI